jgi:hypothetical protein
MVLNGVAHASIVEFAKSHELDSMFKDFLEFHSKVRLNVMIPF